MKITEIKSFLLPNPRDLHIIKIETDAGIYGVGEAGCSTREYGQDGVLKPEAALKYPMKMHEHPHLQRSDGSYTNW